MGRVVYYRQVGSEIIQLPLTGLDQQLMSKGYQQFLADLGGKKRAQQLTYKERLHLCVAYKLLQREVPYSNNNNNVNS